jgi:hypothetical protein
MRIETMYTSVALLDLAVLSYIYIYIYIYIYTYIYICITILF